MAPKFKTSTIKQRHRLIAAVRAQPGVYDPNKASFESIKTTDFMWAQIASECKIKNGQIAKIMWHKMYDCYVCYKKNSQLNKNSPYKMFFKQMKFIDPFIVSHKEASKSPHQNADGQEILTSNQMETFQNFEKIKEEPPSNGEFTTFQYWNETEDEPLPSNNQDETTKTSSGNTESNNEADVEFNSDSDVESYEDIILPEPLNTDNGAVDNSLKMFFDAMYASTSQLSRALQRNVKMKIFSAVLEAEEEAENLKKDALGASCL